jgi:hypothetical protein
MSDELVDFETWLARVFDPETRRVWKSHTGGLSGWEICNDEDAEFNSALCEYMIRAFENGGSVLARFTDDQVANGLDELLMISIPNVIEPYPKDIELALRERFMRSTVTLFSEVLLPRCERMLRADPDAARRSKLDYVMFMFWDTLEIKKDPDCPGIGQVHEAGLESLEKILHLPNDLTQFAALHGLGHAARSYPKKAAAIIDRWLATKPVFGPGMLEYAQQARTGEVL